MESVRNRLPNPYRRFGRGRCHGLFSSSKVRSVDAIRVIARADGGEETGQLEVLLSVKGEFPGKYWLRYFPFFTFIQEKHSIFGNLRFYRFVSLMSLRYNSHLSRSHGELVECWWISLERVRIRVAGRERGEAKSEEMKISKIKDKLS